MPLNYRKNSVTCTTQHYPNVSDLNGPGVCGSNRINIRTGGSTQYIGLVAPGHEQASDLSVRVGSSDLRLAKQSKSISEIYSWGGGRTLGDGVWYGSYIPRTVNYSQCFTKIDIGRNGFGLGLDINGKIWSWGNRTDGTLGDGVICQYNFLDFGVGNVSSPIAVCTPVGCTFSDISVRSYDSFTGGNAYAIDTNGKVWAWGSGICGFLGNGLTTNQCIPVAVCIPTGCTFTKVCSAGQSTIALDTNGKVWGWGLAAYLGIGLTTTNTTCRTCPVAVCTPVGCVFCNISNGYIRAFAMDTNGKTWVWGNDTFGIGGTGVLSCVTRFLTVPTLVCSPSGSCFHKIKSLDYASFGLDTNGKVWAWGRNSTGELGIGISTVAYRCIPVAVCTAVGCTFNDFSFVRGYFDNFTGQILDANGKIWTWGSSIACNLGNSISSQTPTSSTVCIPTSICTNLTFSRLTNSTGASIAFSSRWIDSETTNDFYYQSNYVTPLISTSVSYTPTINLSGVITYSVSPSLPIGLSLNVSTGVISGITPSTTTDQTYTITASSSLGQNRTFQIRIRIVFLNTTLYVGSYGEDSSLFFIGYNTEYSMGGLASNIFKNGTIIRLFHQPNANPLGNIYFTLRSTTSYFLNNDSTWRQITINNKPYLRTSFSYSQGGGPGNFISDWFQTSNNNLLYDASYNLTNDEFTEIQNSYLPIIIE